MFDCMCLRVCMDILGYLSPHEWSYIFTHNHLIVFGDKSNFPQWGLPLWKALQCCLQVPWVLLGKCNIMLSDTPSSDTYLHFLRENGDKAHISHFTLISKSGETLLFHSSEISESITKPISADVVRRPLQGGNSFPVMLLTVWLNCDMLLNDLLPWQGALANNLTLFQSLCVCPQQIHRFAWTAKQQK